METGGFDFVIELNERLINRSLALAFYASYFPEVEGDFVPENIPPELTGYTKMHIKIRLKDPPVIRSVAGLVDGVEVFFHARVDLKLLSDLKIRLDANISASAAIKYDPIYKPEYGAIIVNLLNAKLSGVVLNSDYRFSVDVLKQINEAICAIFKTKLLDDKKEIEVQAKVPDLDLPYIVKGTKLTILPGGFKILDSKVYAIPLNLITDNSARLGDVKNFTGGSDIAAGISEAGMKKAFDFLWNYTTIKKTFSRSETAEIKVWETVMEGYSLLANLGTWLLTGGFIDQDFSGTKMWVEYGATIKFNKPSFNLNVDMVEIPLWPVDISYYAKVKVHFRQVVEFDTSSIIPDDWTPWEDDIELYSTEMTVEPFSWSQNISASLLNLKVQAYLDQYFMLKCKILDFDLDVNLNSAIPNTIIKYLIDLILKLVKDKVPELTITPTLTAMITQEEITIKADLKKFVISEDEAIVGATASFAVDGRQIVPAPRFIANRGRWKCIVIHVHASTKLRKNIRSPILGYMML